MISNISITASRWEYTISALDSTDNDSNIKNYEYILGSSISTSTQTAKAMSGTDNPNYTIKVRAQDNAGNYSEYSEVIVMNIKRLFIRQLYQSLRENGNGKESEVDIWENTNINAASLVKNVFSSEEAANLYSSISKEEMVERLYKAILGRSADTSGKNTHVALMTSDNWLDVKDKIFRSLANSGEAQNIYSIRGIGAGTI
jgi:hypothetical protein